MKREKENRRDIRRMGDEKHEKGGSKTEKKAEEKMLIGDEIHDKGGSKKEKKY
jgi:hypothetical protein